MLDEDLEEVLEEEVVGELEEEEQVKLGAQPLLLPPLLSSSIDQHPLLIYSWLLQRLLGNY